jgi:hypothetical protein
VRYFFAYAILLCLLACTESAEHSNPLDPESPLYTQKGSIAGRVMTFYEPFQPITGAMVEIQPGGLILQSDGEGRFEFTELEPDTFTLIAGATGYQEVAAKIEVNPREISSVNFHLNGLPAIQAPRATSSKVATREASSPRIFLDIAVEVQDPDGASDIKRIELTIPAFSFTDTLARLAGGGGQWQRIFNPAELSQIDLSKLVGLPLKSVVYDFPGAVVSSEPFFLARIISEEPEILSPTNNETTGSAPVFRWQVPPVAFAFTQRIEIFRLDAGFPAFVTAIGNIKPEVRSLPYLGRLSAGVYFWTIRLIDDFGNSSRSKEATFQVR